MHPRSSWRRRPPEPDTHEETAMASSLSLEEMKQFVRHQFEEFVNKQNADVIRETLTADFCDHDGPGGEADRRRGRSQDDARDV